MPDAPAATAVLSSTSTCSPRCARCHAVERPWTPAPITSTEVEEGTGSLMERLLGRWRIEPHYCPMGNSVALYRTSFLTHQALPRARSFEPVGCLRAVAVSAAAGRLGVACRRLD